MRARCCASSIAISSTMTRSIRAGSIRSPTRRPRRLCGMKCGCCATVPLRESARSRRTLEDDTMSWLDRIAAVEELEDAALDASLLADCEHAADAVVGREIRFSTPTFKAYSSCDVQGCGKNAFPAFSVTAGGCALMCDHCQAKVLEPMIPATSPEMLEHKLRSLVAAQELQGFLLSGGSTRKNEIRYERYLPVVERLKHE